MVLRNAFDFITISRRIQMNNKLYVGNLSYDTSESALRELFSKSGNVRSINVIMDRMTNQPRGFAFVEMETPAEAHKAIQMCDGQELDGRSLKVNEAKPMENRSGGFGDGNRGKSNNRRY
jgi:RNA recognition motif-containing protein